jgi:hypothetical protein
VLQRVFALAPDCHNAGRYQRVWQRHFYDGLAGAVPTVLLPRDVDFSWARPAKDALTCASDERTLTSERLWDQIRHARAEGGLDAVISYCFGADVDPELVTRTIELGIPWINFFCDSTYAFDLVERIARVTSLNWFPERAAIADYQALSRPILCRPYAVNPHALPETSCESADHPVGFVGLPTGNRVLHLAKLALLGCSVTVRGDGWRRVHTTPSLLPASPRSSRSTPHSPARRDRRLESGRLERLMVRALRPVISGGARPLSEPELVQFLARCRVVLGLNEGRDLGGRYRSYMKLRDIEFPGYGCCYLTQHNADVEHAFEIGREVLTFRTVREAASLVRRCARRPDEARALGLAARRRVMAEHTWSARVVELARAL